MVSSFSRLTLLVKRFAALWSLYLLPCYAIQELLGGCLVLPLAVRLALFYSFFALTPCLSSTIYLSIWCCSHDYGIWAPSNLNKLSTSLAQTALSYVGCLVTAVITEVAKFSVKKRIPCSRTAWTWIKLQTELEFSMLLGSLKLISLSAWKVQTKPSRPPLSLVGENAESPTCASAALTLRLASLTRMQIITWGSGLAGGCLRSLILAEGCSWLFEWQRRVCLYLSLPVVSTLQDSVLKLKDVSNLQALQRQPGSWEAAWFQPSRGEELRVLAVRHIKLLPKLLLNSTVLCKSLNPPARQGCVQLRAKST